MAKVNLATREIDFGVVVKELFDIIRSDTGVTRIDFEVPDELADWHWKVVYENANGDKYYYEDDCQDGIFSWEIHNTVTRESGRVTYTLEATKDGKVWNSRQQSFYVRRSTTDGGTVDDHTYNEVAELVNRAETAAQNAENSSQDATRAKEAAEAVRISFRATATRTEQSGVRISVTDQNGTTEAELQDGVSPTVSEEDTQEGHTVTITDATGEHSFTIHDGAKGDTGETGDTGDGVSVSSTKSGTVNTVTFSNARTGETLDTITVNDGATGATGPQGAKGDTGETGASVIASSTKSGKTTTVTLKNADTQAVLNTFTVEDGADGQDGQDGQDGTNGQDGHSVNVSSSKSGKVTTVTFTDATTGTTLNTVTLNDGNDGQNGQNGANGQDGYTPVKGTDYFTQAEITSIENDIQTWCQNTILGGAS